MRTSKILQQSSSWSPRVDLRRRCQSESLPWQPQRRRPAEGTSQGQGRGQELRGRNRRRQKISTQSHSPKEIKWDLQHSPTGGKVVIWLCSSSVNSQPSGLRHHTYRSCRWSVASRTSSNSYHRSAWKFQWGSYYTAKWQSLPHPARPWDQATEASKRLCLDRDIKQCLSLNLI